LDRQAYSVDGLFESKKLQCAHRFRCHPANEHEVSLACFGKLMAVCLCSDLIDADEKRDIVDRILSAPKGQLTPAESTLLSDVVGPNSLHFLDALGLYPVLWGAH